MDLKKIFKKRKRKGFTLVEVLIVLTVLIVIFIISSMAIPKQLMKARDAVRKGQLDSFKKAVDIYYQDAECYPRSVPACKNPLVLGDSVIKDHLPCDPKTNLSYSYITDLSSCPSWFQIYTNLEVTEDKIIEKVGCSEGCGPDCQFNYGVSSSNQKLDPLCTVYEEPPPVQQYVCAPGGSCEVFVDPYISGCPNIYPDDPTCQDACSDPHKRCHDASGKTS